MSRRTGAGLSRERVLQAGLHLVDREGVAALTMRRLGKELGVEAMSLYGYVVNKQDLLDGVLDCVYDEMPRSIVVDGPWQDRLRMTARLFRDVLLRHPNTVSLVAARPVMSEGSLGLVESALDELRRIGLDIARANQVLTVIVAFTVGHVASEVGDGDRPSTHEVQAFHHTLDRTRFPNVADRTALGAIDRDAEFALGLDFIVAGVERLVRSPVGAHRPHPPGRHRAASAPVPRSTADPLASPPGVTSEGVPSASGPPAGAT
jgi:AcrR family transcriptional regulator